MKFNEFAKLFNNTPIIESSAFAHYGKANDLRRQALRWVHKKYLYTLKRGMYILGEEFRKIRPSLLFVANQLISPSYISMEYALGIYGLIPEKVTVITSITTKKTGQCNNILGKFEYRAISKKLFFGMTQNAENEQKYFIAEPEKAVLDFFYFAYDAKPDFDYFESMRFQNLETLNKRTFALYSKKYNKRVQNIAIAFLKYAGHLKKEYKAL